MHDSVITCLALLAIVGGCGSDRDLVIGRNQIAAVIAQDGAINVDDGSTSTDASSDAGDPFDATIEATPCPVDEIPPSGSLLHRYSFDGTGNVVRDSVGNADGNVVAGGVLDGNGALTLDGIDDYVNLPNGLISSLTDASIVTWISEPPQNGAVFERVFDFGNSTAGEDKRLNGKTFLMVTPFSDTGDGHDLTMQMSTAGMGVIQIATDRSIRDGNLHQVALVFRNGTGIELYLDAELVGTRATKMKLADIEDVNDWLGQSQFLQDKSNFSGTFTEFRIYGQALSACALQSTANKGPDLLP